MNRIFKLSDILASSSSVKLLIRIRGHVFILLDNQAAVWSQKLTMSLFQFGFSPLTSATSPSTSEINDADFCSTLPTLSESGLGVVEYQQVATAVNKELTAPPSKTEML